MSGSARLLQVLISRVLRRYTHTGLLHCCQNITSPHQSYLTSCTKHAAHGWTNGGKSWVRYISNSTSYTRRSHLCGSLRSSNVDEDVRLCGWLQFSRQGQFLVMRDWNGAVQLVLTDDKKAQFSQLLSDLRLESVLEVQGTVRLRPEGQENKKMTTGEVEVVVSDLRLLNSCQPQLPFDLKGFHQVKESLRMEHRYLDLRHERLQKNLRTRSKMVMKMREFLANKHDFVEVETPTLFRRTPGGAKEFVVPSHIPGKFYSLPQSPQQFKQLLMVGGLDRYFQIARCYRDEGAKPDRQPEFTQVDLEMSFVEADGVMSLVEAMLCESLPGERGEVTAPFPRLTYHQCMTEYGCDKPDTRFEWKLQDVSGVFSHHPVPAFSSVDLSRCSVQALRVPLGSKHLSNKEIEELTEYGRQNLPDSLSPALASQVLVISGSLSSVRVIGVALVVAIVGRRAGVVDSQILLSGREREGAEPKMTMYNIFVLHWNCPTVYKVISLPLCSGGVRHLLVMLRSNLCFTLTEVFFSHSCKGSSSQSQSKGLPEMSSWVSFSRLRRSCTGMTRSLFPVRVRDVRLTSGWKDVPLMVLIWEECSVIDTGEVVVTEIGHQDVTGLREEKGAKRLHLLEAAHVRHGGEGGEGVGGEEEGHQVGAVPGQHHALQGVVAQVQVPQVSQGRQLHLPRLQQVVVREVQACQVLHAAHWRPLEGQEAAAASPHHPTKTTDSDLQWDMLSSTKLTRSPNPSPNPVSRFPLRSSLCRVRTLPKVLAGTAVMALLDRSSPRSAIRVTPEKSSGLLMLMLASCTTSRPEVSSAIRTSTTCWKGSCGFPVRLRFFSVGTDASWVTLVKALWERSRRVNWVSLWKRIPNLRSVAWLWDTFSTCVGHQEVGQLVQVVVAQVQNLHAPVVGEQAAGKALQAVAVQVHLAQVQEAGEGAQLQAQEAVVRQVHLLQLPQVLQGPVDHRTQQAHHRKAGPDPLVPPKSGEGVESAHHPFTAPVAEDEPLIYSHPEQVRGQHYDLVLNGQEIGGGSIRIHSASLQRYVLSCILQEDCSQLEHLLSALDSGCPPHGGIALGLDRLMAIVCQTESIRDVIAFPKSHDGKDPMSKAPAAVSASDLQAYHIAVKPPS
ncbi:aspartate--tRNA ligase, mitochondrial-like [Babylonia areolata]|uniref:aspartate--tRNA ligase, mitochondrial-like n=1 Tax=Babylonia areolata TaxID=304850 RepID=UPI003FCF01EC